MNSIFSSISRVKETLCVRVYILFCLRQVCVYETRLRECAGSSEPSLLVDMISTKIAFALISASVITRATISPPAKRHFTSMAFRWPADSGPLSYVLARSCYFYYKNVSSKTTKHIKQQVNNSLPFS